MTQQAMWSDKSMNEHSYVILSTPAQESQELKFRIPVVHKWTLDGKMISLLV